MSLDHASLAEGGIETKLQLKGRCSEHATLANSWANWFASLLTQKKEQR